MKKNKQKKNKICLKNKQIFLNINFYRNIKYSYNF